MIASPPSRELLLQRTHSPELPALELFVKLREPSEHHVYLKNLSLGDVAAVFESEIRAMTILIYRLPASLLNPNYWEPLTRDAEHAVRERRTGVITRQDGERTLLWRSDSISGHRWLRDGISVQPELLHGYIFRLSGADFLSLAAAWGGGRERLEWMGFSNLPQGDAGQTLALNAHNDVTAFRFSMTEERLAYSSADDSTTRLLFADRGLARRAAGAAIRGFCTNCGRAALPRINDRVCDQVLRIADGIGWSAAPERDFLAKGRTFEFTAHLGRTEWGVHLAAGSAPLLGNEKALVYYDRSSGMWAVAT